MINTERITQWLSEPHLLQELAPKPLLDLASDYPYFSLAHYLKFIATKQDAESLFALQQSHPINPVLFHILHNKSLERPPLMDEMAPAEDHQIDAEATEQELTYNLVNEDYFSSQGIEVSNDLPELTERETHDDVAEDKQKSLMVVMSFAEWLTYISSENKKAKEEEADQKALKTMWQKQKLAAAIEEESEEIPEQVFEMAVNSISRQDEIVSESMAEVYAKQGKKVKAIEMYRKLSLLNPEKNSYFAAKIENLQKDI